MKGFIHCATGERVQVDFFFFFFFTVEGEGGGWKLIFFFPHIYEKVEGGGGKGVHLGFSGNVFFIVKRLRRGSPGVIFLQIHYGTGERVHLDFFSSFFYC